VTRALLALVLALAACGDDQTPACGVDDAKLCARLSYWQLFDDLHDQVPAAGVIPYTVNTPLFSDYTTKDRYLRVPAGEPAAWADVDAFELPVGSMLIKTFSYLHDRRDPSLGRQLLETRLLLRGDDGWHGASYVYDADGRDAVLKTAGATVDATWIHDDGSTRTNAYVVPNSNQCKSCHAEHDDAVSPLGIKARHLNRPGPDGTSITDQLQNLIDLGDLAGAPAPDTWPRLPDAFDPTTGTLEQRARAWLDINCGHCHNPGGLARTTGLFLDITETDPAVLGACKPPVATGPASAGLHFDVVPGQPDQSILLYRISSTEPAVKMPQLGRNLVQDEAVTLIHDWIAAMSGSCGS
jgi:uncharacterized repeat protein (TIGR03806 family)